MKASPTPAIKISKKELKNITSKHNLDGEYDSDDDYGPAAQIKKLEDALGKLNRGNGEALTEAITGRAAPAAHHHIVVD